MAANYDFRENPNRKGKGEKEPLHPRIVSRGIIDTEKLIAEMTRSRSITPGEVKATLSALAEVMAEYMKEGFTVEVDEIGKFHATLKARPVTDKKEIRSSSVHFDTVKFRPATVLRRNIQTGELIRVTPDKGFRNSASLPEEECKKRLARFFEEKPCITRMEYSKLTGKLRSKALEELNKWIRQGYLKRHGSHNIAVYFPGENYHSFQE
ncbi:MAG: HU family DNA-binding protein [Candidatus Azobacteroides sp.]|nr:HU family DNA-binding protein [Candidatus Azobacteroides sp.]